MAIGIGRRQFLSALGGASVALPFAARAQRAALPVIGYLDSASANGRAPIVAALRAGLKESGYVEGQNLAIEYRYADNQSNRLPTLAADLVRRQVAVIAAAGNVAARAAREATSTIPIVFHTADDPIAVGLVSNLNPGTGNVTGVSEMGGPLPTKRLDLLHELVPSATMIGVLLNPHNANARSDSESLQGATRALGLRIAIAEAVDPNELERAFSTLEEMRVGALLIGPDAVFNGQRDRIVSLATLHAIPTVYHNRLFVEVGGLMSYGSSLTGGYRQTGIYVGRILKGEKPTDLPVMQPTKFELVINLKTAKALGLTVPTTLLTTADEVIE